MTRAATWFKHRSAFTLSAARATAQSALYVVLAGLITFPSVGLTHHARTEFSQTIVEMEGELTAIAWRNPHPVMELRVREDSGEKLWRLEIFLDANTLARNSLTGDLFAVGDRIRVVGQPSTRRDVLLLRNVLREDGTEVAVTLEGEPYWDERRIVEIDVPATPEEERYTEAAIQSAEGIFRIWTVADWGRDRFQKRDPPLTAAASASRAEWDELRDEPQIRCEPPGMPSAMRNPHPIEFSRDGSDIILRLEEFELTRRIHMNPDARTANAASSPMGYSVGRWEGDSLVVETTNVDYPYLDQRGAPQSPELEVFERFTLSDDERSLDWEITVSDPGTLTESMNYARTHYSWIPSQRIRLWNCLSLDPAE